MNQEESPLISDRAQQLLKVLIERYISDGQPVGSRTLSKATGMALSSATIRNVMADLEEFGLVASPHTSAGRVPTVQGYRLFVDSLVAVNPLENRIVDGLREQLQISGDSSQLVEAASALLSEATRMAGVVTVPRRNQRSVRRIEFVPLSENRILVVLVVNEHEVQNRVIITERPFSPAQLEQASNFLNEQFAGRDMVEVREQIIGDLKRAQSEMNGVMASAIDLAEAAMVDGDGDDFILAGETNLMGVGGLEDMTELRELFEAFHRKRDILSLLDHCLSADGVQIFIGEESGYRPLDHCSMVTAPYEENGRVVGVLGVIGPTRMDYEHVISVVDVTAKLLGAALNQRD